MISQGCKELTSVKEVKYFDKIITNDGDTVSEIIKPDKTRWITFGKMSDIVKYNNFPYF